MREYFVYIMANSHKMIYIGVTNNLIRRVYEHKKGLLPGYTKKYQITKLVYYESGSDINMAIKREKQLKGWLRKKKVAIIESSNPTWEDLAMSWYDNS